MIFMKKRSGSNVQCWTHRIALNCVDLLFNTIISHLVVLYDDLLEKISVTRPISCLVAYILAFEGQKLPRSWVFFESEKLPPPRSLEFCHRSGKNGGPNKKIGGLEKKIRGPDKKTGGPEFVRDPGPQLLHFHHWGALVFSLTYKLFVHYTFLFANHLDIKQV